MALRLIEVFLPSARVEHFHRVLAEQETLGVWVSDLGGNRVIARILAGTEWTEAICDTLNEHFSLHPEFRLMLFSVEATLPRIPEEQNQQTGNQDGQASTDKAGEAETNSVQVQRISRDELYYDVSQGAQFSITYLATVVLSTLVAAVGLLRGDVAVIIGAMVIAPLLGPNVALALASTLGDLGLAGRSLKTLLAGVATALVLALLIGMLLGVDPLASEIASRTQLDTGHIVLALAAGSAGALAFTTGIPAAVIGVMVAVALLPPLVVVGLLLGAGHPALALNAFLLFLTNVACINLAGVFTFLVRQIRPRSWWEAEQAGYATRIAVTIWAATLAGLLTTILLNSQLE